MSRSRAYRAAYYGLPMLFCLAVHWLALKTWFSADDFAWLKLPSLLQSPSDWLDVLFGPRAQGTIRVIGERLYFLVFTWLFGLNAVPFRVWQFLTAFADMALIGWIAKRLTGSATAGFVAPMLWCANATLSIALDWSSAYNEVCCAFFLLLAFYFLLRCIDTGYRKYWIAQWAAFLLGFGALELNVMYPAVAALYTFLFARRYFPRTLWMFIPAALFTAHHFLFVPKTPDPKYAMIFDAGVFQMLWRYWAFSVGTYRPEVEDWRPVWLGVTVALLGLAGVAALLWKRFRLTLFCLGWFVVILAPILPLQAHFTEYYGAIPAIGLALLGGVALTAYPRIAAPFLLLCLALSISEIRVADRFFYERAKRIQRVIQGLQADRANYQGKTVLLAGVDNELFASGFYDDPFELIGIPQLYLAPGTEKAIDPHPEWGGLARYTISLDGAVDLLRQGKAEIYEAGGTQFRRVTNVYRSIAFAQYAAAHRDRVDVGDPIYAPFLSEGWYQIDNAARWMAKRATVQLGSPSAAGKSLTVAGFCPPQVLESGPLELTVTAAGRKIGTLRLSTAGPFTTTRPLPPEAAGQYALPVTVEVNRTSKIGGDLRPLGLIFGTFTIK